LSLGSQSSHKILDKIIQWQSRHALMIVIVGAILSAVCAPRAIKLLGKVATELETLLPTTYENVQLNKEIKKKFNRRSSLSLILSSPKPENNQKAALATKAFLEALPEVDFVENEKTGYDFFDKHKLTILSLEQLYAIRDKVKSRIQKEKLGGLYIDFEDDSKASGSNSAWDDLKAKYKSLDTGSVQNRYLTNAEGTVYVLKIYPKNTDTGLKFFKLFGELMDQKVRAFNPGQFGPGLEWGYAGAIKTRVDEYDTLIQDLTLAGTISAIVIFFILFIYFRNFVAAILIFIPMIYATLIGFWFNSLFFGNLNIVTSFLFSIILGLGVDIGIHMLTRYMQDRRAGLDSATVHRNVLFKTGKSCVLGILTTVASFYILVINDFKGFSDFGWIAGNGLVIALLGYLIFFPPVILLAERWKLLRFKAVVYDPNAHATNGKTKWIPYAAPLLIVVFLVAAVGVWTTRQAQFEWNFNNLKIKIPERMVLKEKLKSTSGRVNSPAAYIVANAVEARRLGAILVERKRQDEKFPTIEDFRSYYDIVPLEAEEKISVVKEIDALLKDDALNSLDTDDKRLVNEFRQAAAEAAIPREGDVPPEVREMFFGNVGNGTTSLAYVSPLPNMELDNGYNAEAFYEDVHVVPTLGKRFLAVSDSIIFAEVLRTLFHDSGVAIVLSTITLILLIWLDFRDLKRTSFILGGLACGIFWMFGLMYLFDLKLNFYNMIIIPAMIGMGEDNSVHVVNRFEEIGRRSILEVLRSSGGAAFMASLTTMIGYGGLCFAHHPGLNSIGWMAIAGMGSCLVGSLFVLPLLLQLFLKAKPGNR